MDADIAQGVHAAGVAGYEHRAGGSVEAEKPAFCAETRRMVYGHPGPSKDPLPLGGKHIRIVKQGRVGHNLARAAQLLAQSGNTGRKIHRGSPLIGCCVRRPE